MTIKFACSCGKAYKVPEKFSGKRVKCKKCGEAIRVPSESQSGVQSQRAAAVSKRSVLASQRIDKTSGIHERSSKSARISSGTSSKSARTSSKSARTSSKSARTSSKSARTSSKSARTSKRSKRAGGTTERFAPLDLNEGNLLKKFQRKRDEEFQRGEGRLTWYVNGKPKKAFNISRKGCKIGREGGCDVSIPVESVSAEHVKLEYKLGTFIATDLQSTNGFLVNGRSIRRASLKDGDVLQLGEAIVRIDCG